MWIRWNPNPTGRNVGDCAIRAVAKALDTDWETAFAQIAVNAYGMGDILAADSVWGSVLRQHGFYREAVPNTCPDCYTIAEFALDHPQGTYVVGTGNHVVCIKNGSYYDTWDSGTQPAIYYWFRKDE